jgi:hypothetical protein
MVVFVFFGPAPHPVAAAGTDNNHSQRVPDAPDPSAISARDGMESTRAVARRYLPDAMRLFAGIAISSNFSVVSTRQCILPDT